MRYLMIAVLLVAGVAEAGGGGGVADSFRAAAGAVSPGSSAMAHAAEVPKGRAVTSDKQKIMISKDVGSERWAISWEADGYRVVGNVFRPGGATFIDCLVFDVTGTGDPTRDDLRMECRSGDGYVASTGWGILATDLHVPLSFFY